MPGSSRVSGFTNVLAGNT